jgi:hypothetical protein
VTRESFKLVVDKKGATQGLSNEFEQRFLEHQVMTTLSVVYPQL